MSSPIERPDAWDRLSGLARHAPTPHNTQPYRLRPTSEREAEIVLVCSRLLPIEDREDRYLYATLGIFLEALDLAGRAAGLALTAGEGADPGVLDLESPDAVVGWVRLGDPVAPDPTAERLLTERCTSRLPYHPRPVPPAEIARLTALVASSGHRLLVESEPARVRDLLRQNALAVIDNLQIGSDRREIERWVRYGETPEAGDGLWERPLCQPAWELQAGFRCPALFAAPGLRELAVRRYVATQRGTCHVALLAGPFAAWTELIDAGRVLMRLWTLLTELGLSMHPFGSTLTNPHHARAVGDRFDERHGWLIFRFGYSDPPPRAPRLASLVIR